MVLIAPHAAAQGQPNAQADSAPTVRGIRPAVEQIYAVRGGVLMVPLTAETPGRNWPAWMTLTLDDGSVIEGQVAWIAARTSTALPRMRQWTDDSQHLTVRPIEPGDSTAAPSTSASTTAAPSPGSPTLVAPMPVDGSGNLTLEGQTIRVTWLDPPTQFARGVQLPDMPAMATADRPDPTSPFSWWRWVLLGERIGARPPAITNFIGIEQQVAQSIADLWLVGMRSLEHADAEVAHDLRALLTATCDGRRGSIAAWITHPESLNTLLGLLLDQRRAPTRRVIDVRAWIEDQPPMLVWPVRLYGRQVRIAAANRTDHPIDLDLAWVRSEGSPERVRLRPHEVREFDVARPTRLQDQALGERIDTMPLILDVRYGTRRSSIQFPAQAIEASPPGVELRGLHLPLTLADVEIAQQPVVDAAHMTSVHVRKRSGRWEVFFDCRRPASAAGSDASAPPLPLALRNPEDVIGREAVTLLIGRGLGSADSLPEVMLVIPEHGWWKVPFGDNDGTLQIHRRSYDDRWLCRVVLPEAWAKRLDRAAELADGRFNQGDDRLSVQLQLAVCRTHGDTQSIETGPGRITSWQIDPARMHVELSTWDD